MICSCPMCIPPVPKPERVSDAVLEIEHKWCVQQGYASITLALVELQERREADKEPPPPEPLTPPPPISDKALADMLGWARNTKSRGVEIALLELQERRAERTVPADVVRELVDATRLWYESPLSDLSRYNAARIAAEKALA